MPIERNDVKHPLWRKKVDGSLLRHGVTPIPGWVGRMWSIETAFPQSSNRDEPRCQVSLRFQKETFSGSVTCTKRKRGNGVEYRLWFEDGLKFALGEVFVMSKMRDLESRLRAADGDETNVEEEIPFWEFVDIEFERASKLFELKAYYVQKASFPALFKRLSGSPPLKRIDDQLMEKAGARIYKQNWKPRLEFETELGSTNVIYMLADTERRLLYVGEAESLVPRFLRGHQIIPKWNFYRYNALPASLAPLRLQIERMIIRDIDSMLGSSARSLPVAISEFKLVNIRIDR